MPNGSGKPPAYAPYQFLFQFTVQPIKHRLDFLSGTDTLGSGISVRAKPDFLETGESAADAFGRVADVELARDALAGDVEAE